MGIRYDRVMTRSTTLAPLDALKRAGLRATAQRVALLAHLMRFREPATVEDITRALRGTLDPVTAYRSLSQMRDAGLVRALTFGGAVQYEYAARHHHHLVCRRCGRIEDVDVCVPVLPPRSVARAGFASVTDHSLEFFGMCAACA